MLYLQAVDTFCALVCHSCPCAKHKKKKKKCCAKQIKTAAIFSSCTGIGQVIPGKGLSLSLSLFAYPADNQRNDASNNTVATNLLHKGFNVRFGR